MSLVFAVCSKLLGQIPDVERQSPFLIFRSISLFFLFFFLLPSFHPALSLSVQRILTWVCEIVTKDNCPFLFCLLSTTYFLICYKTVKTTKDKLNECQCQTPRSFQCPSSSNCSKGGHTLSAYFTLHIRRKQQCRFSLPIYDLADYKTKRIIPIQRKKSGVYHEH